MAYEFARVLWRLGCDVRVYDPAGLPQKDDVQHDHVKVQELRELSKWSDGHVWVSPEQHGQLVSTMTPAKERFSLPNSLVGVLRASNLDSHVYSLRELPYSRTAEL